MPADEIKEDVKEDVKDEIKEDGTEAKTFSQEQVNSLLADQKRDLLKTQNDTLESLGFKSIDEIKDTLANKDKDINTHKLTAFKYEALSKVGLSTNYIDFLNGEDIETLTANATKLAELANVGKQSVPPKPNTEKTVEEKNKDFESLLLNKVNKKEGN